MGNNIFISQTFAAMGDRLIEEVKNNLKFGEENFIIVPPQFTLTMQQLVYEALGNKAYTGLNIVSLRYFINYSLKDKINDLKILTNTSRVLLVNKILNEKKRSGSFKSIKISDNKSKLSNDFLTTIDLFKKSSVTPADLQNYLESTPLSSIQRKIKDINNVYSDFSNALSQNYGDYYSLAETYLDLLKNGAINVSKMHIYVSDFCDVDVQGYNIFLELYRKAKSFNICFLQPDKENKNASIFPHLFRDRFLSDISNEPISYSIQNIDIHLDEKRSAIFKNLFTYKIPVQRKMSGIDISLSSYDNIKSEILGVAKEIEKLINDKSIKNPYRYKEISVVVPTLDRYSSYIKDIFSEYKIPYFIEERQKLYDQASFFLIQSALQAIESNFYIDNVLELLYSPFITFNEEDKMKYENFLRERFIHNNCLEKAADDITKDDVTVSKINNCLKKWMTELKKTLNTVREAVEGIREFLSVIGFEETLARLYAKINNEHGDTIKAQVMQTSKNKIDKILNDFDEILGEEKFSRAKLIDMLKTTAKETSVSNLPAYLDNVYIGTLEFSRFASNRVLFVLGLDGDAVNINSDRVGIISSKDIELLKIAHIDLLKYSEQLDVARKHNILQLLTVPKDKLYVSLARFYDDELHRRSTVMMELSLLFGIEIRDRKNIVDEYSSEYEIENKICDIKNSIEADDFNADSNNVQDDIDCSVLYKNKDGEYVLYPSMIETYLTCPFKALANDILYVIDDYFTDDINKELGIIRHKVLEVLLKERSSRNIILKYIDSGFDKTRKVDLLKDNFDLDEKEFKKIIKNAFDKVVNNYDEFKYKKRRPSIEREVNSALEPLTKNIILYFKLLRLLEQRPFAQEYSLGAKNAQELHSFNENDVKVVVEGKIDAINTNNNKANFSIIDFKSSMKNLDDNNIQLYAYAKAYEQESNRSNNLIGYVRLNNKYVSEEKDSERTMFTAVSKIDLGYLKTMLYGLSDKNNKINIANIASITTLSDDEYQLLLDNKETLIINKANDIVFNERKYEKAQLYLGSNSRCKFCKLQAHCKIWDINKRGF